MLKHLILFVIPFANTQSSFRLVTQSKFSYPVCIVLRISGSSNNSLTEVLGWYSDNTCSSVAVNKAVTCPKKLYAFSQSIAFRMNVGSIT